MAREPIPTWFYALVVVRLGRRFLVVREASTSSSVPARGARRGGRDPRRGRGARDPRDSGVPVTLEGVLRVEHSPQPHGGTRVRVFFVARPSDDTAPKQEPDAHSLEARWVTLDELEGLALRSRGARRVPPRRAWGSRDPHVVAHGRGRSLALTSLSQEIVARDAALTHPGESA